MSQVEESPLQLPFRTLPTQTEAAFWIIVAVFLGTLLAGLVGASPIYMLPVVLSMLILPAREVLAIPRRELARQDEEATADLKEQGIYQKIQSAITALAAEAGYHKPIKLIISQKPTEARASGSWRRHYILLGAAVAEKVAADFDDPEQRGKARALLLHEIGHIVNRDVQRIGYTRELLRSCATVLPWWALFLIGWLGFAFLAAEAVLVLDVRAVPGLDPTLAELIVPMVELSPAEKAEIAEKMRTISIGLVLAFIVNAFLPILSVGFVLWLFFWRRMAHTQEYYADQLALSVDLDWRALARATGRYPGWVRPAPPQPASLFNRLQQVRQRLASAWALQPLGFHSQKIQPLFRRAQRWFSTHPTYYERHERWREPAKVFTDWRGAAWSTAVLVLALDVMLVTPLASYHLAGYPLHISTLAIFVLLSTWLLPFIVLDRPFRQNLAKMLLIIFGLRWAWLVINLGLLLALVFFAPGFAEEILNLLVITGSRFAGNLAALPVDDPQTLVLSTIPGYLGLQFLQIITVPLLLLLYYLLHHGAAASDSKSIYWSRRHWLSVIALSVFAVTFFLTPVSDILNGDVVTLWQPSRLVSYALGAILGLGAWLMATRYASGARNA